jgi:hypothetical protein
MTSEELRLTAIHFVFLESMLSELTFRYFYFGKRLMFKPKKGPLIEKPHRPG